MSEVSNQAPPRTGLNEFETNRPLAEGVERFDAGWAAGSLGEAGALVGGADFQRDAELAERHAPQLRSHDRWGSRIDEVDYDDSYHRVIAAAIEHGAHTSAWATPRPGASVARAAMFMLFAQVEPGHACPLSMTHAAVPALEANPELSAAWLPRMLSTQYDPQLRPGKPGAIFGMAMTEKQGGSDVRANTTVAVNAGDGSWQLTGHKWFCSAPMSDAFLVLAQAPGGLSCFLLPRVLDDGSRNVFRIQRLKDKVGNRSNASSEVEFEGTRAWLVGEEGRGVRTIIEMVARTRLDCVLGTAAGMRQGVAEALWHAQHRSAFGARLIDQPAMTSVLADLALESEAATLTALRLARAHDDDADDAERAFRRLATAVAKYYICKRGPGHAYEAMECLGGNGYTEDFPLGRRYREQPVLAIWEGSGNVIALDVLRALQRQPDALDAFLDEVELAAGEHPALDAHVRRLRGGIPESEAQARRLSEDLALALQASLMLRYSPAAFGAAFAEARLGQNRGGLYGVLAPAAEARTILQRA